MSKTGETPSATLELHVIKKGQPLMPAIIMTVATKGAFGLVMLNSTPIMNSGALTKDYKSFLMHIANSRSGEVPSALQEFTMATTRGVKRETCPFGAFESGLSHLAGSGAVKAREMTPSSFLIHCVAW